MIFQDSSSSSFFFKIVNVNSSNGLVISLEIVGFLVARKGNV